MSTTTRKWIYRVAIAAFPVACFYFPALIPAAPMWLALILALLNVPADEPGDHAA